MKRWIALAALVASVGAAHAATLVVLGGNTLTGARAVLVDGSLYNVDFRNGRCNDVFNGCDLALFAFTSEASARAAAQALLDQVFIDGPDGAFDSVPADEFPPEERRYIKGCELSFGGCRAFTPFAAIRSIDYPNEGSVYTMVAVNSQTERRDTVLGPSRTAFEVWQSSYNDTWAVWAPVPEPGSAALLGVGLLGLFATHRRVRPAARRAPPSP